MITHSGANPGLHVNVSRLLSKQRAAGGHRVTITSVAVHADAGRDVGMEAALDGRTACGSSACVTRPVRRQVAAALQRGAARQG